MIYILVMMIFSSKKCIARVWWDERRNKKKKIKDLTSQFNKFIKQCYSVGWRVKSTEKKSKVGKTKNGRRILLSKCVVYDSTKSRFTKEQEGSKLFSSLVLRTSLSSPS